MTTFADKLNRLFEAAQTAEGRALSNRFVAQSITDAGTAISESLVYYLRSGERENPTKRHIEGLAEFFGVSTGYFFSDSGELSDEDLAVSWAMRQKDVRAIALRSSQMTPRMRQWLMQTISSLDDAREPDRGSE